MQVHFRKQTVCKEAFNKTTTIVGELSPSQQRYCNCLIPFEFYN